MKEILFMLVMAFCIGSCFFSANSADERDRQVRAGKQRWMEAHKCTRTGYAGKYADPVYQCDDGQAYMMYDMPQAN